MTPDQRTDPTSVDNDTYDRESVDSDPHPYYRQAWIDGQLRQTGRAAFIGDEVREYEADDPSAGTVVAIYLDGMVELSTGDRVPAADLVLLRRAQ